MHREPVHSDNEDAYVRARKRMRFVVVALLILACSTISAFANPTVQTRWVNYAVTGTTVDTILQQMRDNGPNGSWAYTRWYVRWTASCEVALEINYTMPKHTRRGAMPANIRAEWDKMIAALMAHEEQHGAHGRNAARELVQKRCRNGNAIVQKWAEQDRIYDRVTDHGRTEGVTFP
ncbi:MAG: DUF922 domain-containing protein [Pseudomonadota bacterium]